MTAAFSALERLGAEAVICVEWWQLAFLVAVGLVAVATQAYAERRETRNRTHEAASGRATHKTDG